MNQVVPGVHRLSFGMVNVFLIEDDAGLVLVDAALPNSSKKILEGVRELGYQPQDVHHILVTHLHSDHIGGLPAVKKATGAVTVAHPTEAAAIRSGKTWRSVQPAPGLLNAIVYRLFIKGGDPSATSEPSEVELEVTDGETLPFGGGIQAIHTPGHSAGHMVYLWPHQGGVLFVGDAATAMLGRLGYPPIFEDQAEGMRSLAKIAALDFSVACLSHGKPLVGDAKARFQQKWADARE